MLHRRRIVQIVAGLLLAMSSLAGAQPSREVVVFGAASLTDVINELEKAFTQETGIPLKTSFAASSTLARQIESGARADVFFPADEEWMDYLQSRQLIRAESRKDVVGNKLVLIAPADSTLQILINSGPEFAKTLGSGRLATGDPDSVPVGKYAKAALMNLGAWETVEKRLVRTENVRSALAFVARGEVPLGIVYLTDAHLEKKVRVVGIFPPETHPPIVYPIALTSVASPEAAQFIRFVTSPLAREIFVKHGFEPVQ
jgi:molybdate transport system substrate-binding protein